MSIFAGLWGYLIAGLIALGGVGAALFGARKAGADAEKAKTATETVKAQQRMQRAEEAGPRTRAEIIDELRRGGL